MRRHPLADQKVPVTERALLQRINRRLEDAGRAGQQLRKNRNPGVARGSLGPYFVVDLDMNAIVDPHVSDLEALGRKVKALAPYEALAPEST